MTRTSPGLLEQAVRVLTDAGLNAADGDVRDTLARCLLTGADRDVALARATQALRLPAGVAVSLLESLRKPEGSPVILDGAESMLRQARAAGWRVIAVTNAAQWSEPLPDRLRRHVEIAVSSSDLGLLKQQPAFWVTVLARHEVDASRSLVVGDNPVADATVPAGQGLCSVVRSAGRPSLAQIGDWLASAVPPPPDTVGLVAGTAITWAGQQILEAPHLSALVVSVTRLRVCAYLPNGNPFTTAVVRRRGLPPAVLLPRGVSVETLLWLSRLLDQRSLRMPADLVEALRTAAVSLDELPERERRHLVSLVREAHNVSVRQMRIADIVAFARRLTDKQGRAHA